MNVSRCFAILAGFCLTCIVARSSPPCQAGAGCSASRPAAGVPAIAAAGPQREGVVSDAVSVLVMLARGTDLRTTLLEVGEWADLLVKSLREDGFEATWQGVKKFFGVLVRFARTNVDIAFYGVVVDQDAPPVPGYELSAVVVPTTFESFHFDRPTPRREYKVIADKEGRFEIHSWGTSLVINLTQDGYVISKWEHSGFNYDPTYGRAFQPDPKHPVTFHVWRKGPTEWLVEWYQALRFRLPGDGSTVTLDLIGGAVRPGKDQPGDLRLSVRRPPGTNPRGPYDWSYSIEAVDGGIADVPDDPFLYRAPAEGYQPRVGASVKCEYPAGPYHVEKRLYLKLRGGRAYAGLALQIDSHDGEGAAVTIISGQLNPAGSRNLQRDSLKTWSASGGGIEDWQPQVRRLLEGQPASKPAH